MEQFEMKTEMVCRWWEVGGEKVLKRHTKKLRKIGSSHIMENIQKGFTSGDLERCKINLVVTKLCRIIIKTETK